MQKVFSLVAIIAIIVRLLKFLCIQYTMLITRIIVSMGV